MLICATILIVELEDIYMPHFEVKPLKSTFWLPCSLETKALIVNLKKNTIENVNGIFLI